MKTGVYLITAPCGARYVGSSVKIEQRWGQHRSMLRTGRHPSALLQRLANSYGVDAFKFGILLICDKRHLRYFEQRAINSLKPECNGLDIIISGARHMGLGGGGKREVSHPHPGVILAEEFLLPMHISAYKLSKDIGVPQMRISEIIAGTRAITVDTGLRLSRYFGVNDEFWTGLQLDHDTAMARDSLAAVLDKIPRAHPAAA